MTRKSCLTTMSCAALVAALAAYGCGSSTSVIDLGTGGGAGRTTGGGQGGVTGGGRGGATGGGVGGATAGGQGGAPAGGQGGARATDAGAPADAGAACVNFAACTGNFACQATCNVNGNPGNPGTRACACGNNNVLNCGGCVASNDGGTPPPVVDAGLACPGGGAVRNGQPCTLGTPSCSRVFGGGAPQTCTCGRANGGGAVWTCQ